MIKSPLLRMKSIQNAADLNVAERLARVFGEYATLMILEHFGDLEAVFGKGAVVISKIIDGTALVE